MRSKLGVPVHRRILAIVLLAIPILGIAYALWPTRSAVPPVGDVFETEQRAHQSAAFVERPVGEHTVRQGIQSGMPTVAPRHVQSLAEREDELQRSEAFQQVSAALAPLQRREIARLVALYERNVTSILTTAQSESAADDMRRQLLADTLAQLRVRLPDSAWAAFLRSRLINDAHDAGQGAASDQRL